MNPAKSVVLVGGLGGGRGTEVPLEQSSDSRHVAFLPVTWGIPRERSSTDPADSRYRTSNEVFLTGVRVRFTVNFTGSWKIRMSCYKPSNHAGVHNFHRYDPAGYPTTGPVQGFLMPFYSPGVAALFPGGPYACTLIDKSEGVGGRTAVPAVAVPVRKYILESSDGTVYGADLAKGMGKPIADVKFSSQFVLTRGQIGTSADFKEITWYVPINKMVRFNREQAGEMMDTGYQIAFSLYCPSIVASTVPVRVGVIPKISVKVYYR
jgi:hypothetical protein